MLIKCRKPFRIIKHTKLLKKSHSAENGSEEGHLMSTQLDRADSHLATAGERKAPTRQPLGLISIRRNHSRKIEILNIDILL
jgi:hypothetical protein